MCEMAQRDARDLVHICFRTFDPFTPTGLIVVVYRDGSEVRLHSRSSVVWVAKDECVRLCGVEDEPDLNCHFIFRPGKKLMRKEGFPTGIDSIDMLQAADRIDDLIKRGVTGDVSNERLAFYHTFPRAQEGWRRYSKRRLD